MKSFLEKHNLGPAIDPESGQLYCGYRIENSEFVLLLTPSEDHSLLQFVLFFPVTFSKEREAELGRLILKLNNLLDLPGLGLEEVGKTIYFRHAQPLAGSHIEEEVFLALMSSIPNIASTFLGVIHQVASGEKNVDDIG